jgi:hypothetical protein
VAELLRTKPRIQKKKKKIGMENSLYPNTHITIHCNSIIIIFDIITKNQWTCYWEQYVFFVIDY